jgi:hypothetical protein
MRQRCVGLLGQWDVTNRGVERDDELVGARLGGGGEFCGLGVLKPVNFGALRPLC